MSTEERQFTTEELNKVNRNAAGQVIINPEIFAAQVNIGWKRDQLARHYEIPAAGVTEILSQLGLKLRKFKKKAYVIEGIAPETETEVQEEGNFETTAVEDVTEVQEVEQPVEDIAEPETTENSHMEEDEEDEEIAGTPMPEAQQVRGSWAN